MSKIKKVLNSSVILVEDEKMNEYIILGKGIGFGRKKGQAVNDKGNDFEYFYPIKPDNLKLVTKILENIPTHILNISNEIISYARKELSAEFNDSLYYMLADHINFAIERYEKNIIIQNRLTWEIQSFYPQEYKVADYSLKYINNKLKINLPESESINIAFHFINSKSNNGNYDSEKYSKAIGDIVKISINSLNLDIDYNDINFIRYSTHIKFLVERIFSNNMLENTNKDLYYMLKNNNEKEYKVANEIKDFIYSKFNVLLSDEEMTFIIVHLNRLYNK